VRISGTALLAALSAHGVTAVTAAAPEVLVSVALNGGAGATPSALGLTESVSKALAWAKIKLALAAAACALVLIGGAGFLLLVRQAPPRAPASGFSRVAGNWTGTFEMRGSPGQEAAVQPARLSIRPLPGGRDCEIEMTLSAGANGLPIVYRFTHQLNERGDRISTEDDPQVSRSDGEGVITESLENPRTGEWRLGFRTPHEDQQGFSDSTWSYRDNQLSIVRTDSASGNARLDGIRSQLTLHRVEEARR